MNEYCPICGKKKAYDESLVAYPGAKVHRCRPATLKGIDATRSVDDRAERSPEYAERLERGFRMLRGKG